jgi:hypothetical protein
VKAALQREYAAGAQPVGVLARNVDQDARLAVRAEVYALHAADREAGESQVHAHQHALGIVSHQHQALGAFEHPARIHHVQHKTAYQRGHHDQQQQRLEFNVGGRPDRRSFGGKCHGCFPD